MNRRLLILLIVLGAVLLFSLRLNSSRLKGDAAETVQSSLAKGVLQELETLQAKGPTLVLTPLYDQQDGPDTAFVDALEKAVPHALQPLVFDSYEVMKLLPNGMIAGKELDGLQDRHAGVQALVVFGAAPRTPWDSGQDIATICILPNNELSVAKLVQADIIDRAIVRRTENLPQEKSLFNQYYFLAP